jgi:RNA polymerase sigma-70 factor (ECF subfamily)
MFERLIGRRRTDGRTEEQIEDQSDAELHHAALKGSGEAMAALYRRHGGLVYRFTLRMSQDVSIAEEVTQEVFLALLRQMERFDPERAALSTWLCGIARRQLWKHLERRGEDASAVGEDDAPEAESLEDSPATWLMRRETVAAVRLGIDELPLPLKEVIVLCELEEMTYEEAAIVLAVPIGTVRSRLHRAKSRLATQLRGNVVSAGTEKKC